MGSRSLIDKVTGVGWFRVNFVRDQALTRATRTPPLVMDCGRLVC